MADPDRPPKRPDGRRPPSVHLDRARARDDADRTEFSIRRDFRKLDGDVARMTARSEALGDDIERTKRLIAEELRRERWGHGPFKPGSGS
jgi:hypothetical protein